MVSIVLVEPEHEINIGMVARVMKNTGFSNLIIVDPKCRIGNIVKRHGRTDRSAVALMDFLKRAGRYLSKRTAILFGREGTGLNCDETDMCDVAVPIEANPHYPVFNILHAAQYPLLSFAV